MALRTVSPVSSLENCVGNCSGACAKRKKKKKNKGRECLKMCNVVYSSGAISIALGSPGTLMAEGRGPRFPTAPLSPGRCWGTGGTGGMGDPRLPGAKAEGRGTGRRKARGCASGRRWQRRLRGRMLVSLAISLINSCHAKMQQPLSLSPRALFAVAGCVCSLALLIAGCDFYSQHIV